MTVVSAACAGKLRAYACAVAALQSESQCSLRCSCKPRTTSACCSTASCSASDLFQRTDRKRALARSLKHNARSSAQRLNETVKRTVLLRNLAAATQGTSARGSFVRKHFSNIKTRCHCSKNAAARISSGQKLT
jgi:hypothetical protein